MRKHRRILVLLWVLGSMVLFSGGALAAATPNTDYSSDALGSTQFITNSSAKIAELTAPTPIDQTSEGGILQWPPRVPSPSLVADFGALGALCRYVGYWRQMALASSNFLVSTLRTLVANFPGFGLYQHNGTAWTQLTPNDSVENLTVVWRLIQGQSPYDDYGDFDVYGDYGSLGLWRYDVYRHLWHQITVANPDKMQANGSNLLANFPGDGLYQYDGTSWTRLTPNSSVENLLGIAGNVYADFGSLGLWKYDGEWHNLSYSAPNMMENYGGILIANFPGYGLYEHDGITWTQLTSNDTVEALIVVADDFYADYGTLGLWKYTGFQWEQITTADANNLGSYGNHLVANFPGYGGLYQYDEIYSSWAPLTDNSGVTNMVSVNLP